MKTIGIADLKAHLSQHLRAVRRGETLTVVDRETPIARILPYEPETAGALTVTRRSTKALRTGRVPLPPPLKLRRDALEFLLEERQSER